MGDDKAVLVPIDISAEAFGEVYDGHEELVEQMGAKGVAEIVIEAAKVFETSKLNFKEDERPIPMTVSEWKQQGDEETDEDEDDEAADGDEEDDGEGAEEGEEEEGEEEDAEVDE